MVRLAELRREETRQRGISTGERRVRDAGAGKRPGGAGRLHAALLALLAPLAPRPSPRDILFHVSTCLSLRRRARRDKSCDVERTQGPRECGDAACCDVTPPVLVSKEYFHFL
ncbi:hypothetical protein EYF80_064865 [Liparis tanakae]|uniref:Uncharacterized protein n=1 Tax=Liparis tanakae TaxID=230148 RepID=A0A4Z2E875_9TELE|nr:hypothetical protein EYF80_064865 [Liparis tanakae]